MPHRNNSFDLLRLIAAVAVLFSHGYPLSNLRQAEPITHFTHYGSFGQLAVNTFFIISGYFVAGSYLRSTSPINFITKRALRILPAMWFVVILTVFIFGPLLTTLSTHDYFSQSGTYTYLSNLFFYLQNPLPGVFETNPDPFKVNGALWTLSYEVSMYAIVFILGVFGCLTKRMCIAVIIAFGIAFLLIPEALHPTAWIFMLFGFSYFVGALFNFIGEMRNKYAALAGLLTLILFAKSGYASYLKLIILPYLVMYVGFAKSKFFGFISKNGDYSYGIYVWGFLVEQTIAMMLGSHVSPMRIFLFGLPITFLFALMSWHLIEKPSLAKVKSVSKAIENAIYLYL